MTADIYKMTPEERRAWLEANPELAEVGRAIARFQAATEFDSTNDTIARMLEAMGVSATERNDLLAQTVAHTQSVMAVLPGKETRDVMRALDAIWLGAVVHKFRDKLFPGTEWREGQPS